MPEKFSLIVTCEHATNHLPSRFRRHFLDRREILASHCAYDAGAVNLARKLAARFQAPCLEAPVSRLLVDCNRSMGHRRLFAAGLNNTERADLLDDFYLPFRQAVMTAVNTLISEGKTVLHLSVHTFTPSLNGKERQADVAFLYDPQRLSEKIFCRHWRTVLKKQEPDLRLRRNYPYRGIADGFTSALRKQLRQELYLGIELEVNQRFVSKGEECWQRLQKQIIDSLSAVTTGLTPIVK